eukprot:gene18857-biopygen5452
MPGACHGIPESGEAGARAAPPCPVRGTAPVRASPRFGALAVCISARVQRMRAQRALSASARGLPHPGQHWAGSTGDVHWAGNTGVV